MEILVVFILLFTVTVIPVKIGANILKLNGSTLGVCFFAVILSVFANALSTGLIGEGFFPSFVALIITGFFFAWIFRTNVVTGFILAAISIAVQLGIAIAIAGLGFALLA